MPQLIVRKIETTVVNSLRRQASAEGVSVEEAHRRLLRRALLGAQPSHGNFIDYLRSMPAGVEFPRLRDLPRKTDL
jgi:plasmid stability protein